MATTVDKVLAWVDRAAGSELRAVAAKIAAALGPDTAEPTGLIFQQAAGRYAELQALEKDGRAPVGTAENFALNIRAVTNQYGHRYGVQLGLKLPGGPNPEA